MGNGVVFHNSGLQLNRSARLSRRRRDRIWWFEHEARNEHTASSIFSIYMVKYLAKSDNIH
jgi:hypothetical protein